MSPLLGGDMFYEGRKPIERAVVVLTPAESKRLIATAVKEMPEVKAALKKGRVIIIGGTNAASKRIKPVVIKDGEVVDVHPNDILPEFTAEDVYIKGANAVDMEGNAGVLMSDSKGGTIGAAMGILHARGSHLIVPVGLEKLVPSVRLASAKLGQGRIRYATGHTVGMMPLMNAKVITEIQAIEILFGADGVRATHAASGGIGGSEGSVVIVLEGEENGVRKAFEFIREIKGEAQ